MLQAVTVEANGDGAASTGRSIMFRIVYCLLPVDCGVGGERRRARFDWTRVQIAAIFRFARRSVSVAAKLVESNETVGAPSSGQGTIARDDAESERRVAVGSREEER